VDEVAHRIGKDPVALLQKFPGRWRLMHVKDMRKGAPTQPLFAGAVIGLLSASVGAMAYTIACKNDGTAFVAIWYTVACVIMAAIGAVVGYRVLRW